MVRRIFLAYLLCPLGGPAIVGLIPTFGFGQFIGGGLMFAGLAALFSYPFTILVGYPVLYLFTQNGERRWWAYAGVGCVLGLLVGLLFGPLASLVAVAGAINGLTFWAIG